MRRWGPAGRASKSPSEPHSPEMLPALTNLWNIPRDADGSSLRFEFNNPLLSWKSRFRRSRMQLFLNPAVWQ